ncbi:MAG TPA: 50S ribosomal protein L25 [Deltaproteobacteria bacterium]|nr:50S ribosomal protein L25 [Deltaproteobacteria bacterium]
MKTIELQANTRPHSGTRASRALRAQGYLPAVFYGFGVEPISLSLREEDFLKELAGERAEGTFVKLSVRDEAGDVSEKLSIVKQLQVDTLKRRLVHADFYEIKMDRELTVDLQVHFKGHPRGVEEGGEVQHLKREVRISGLPGSLPESIELDISELGIGDTLMVGDLVFDEGIQVLDGEDVALVTVSAMRVTAEEEVAEEEAEGEGQKEEPEE